MKATKTFLRSAVTLSTSIGFAFALAGCATVPGESPVGAAPENANVQRSADRGHCNTGAAALVGGLLGALAGSGKGHLVGAAIGAGIGALACTAYNYHTRRLEGAEPVNAAYVQQHGELPRFNTVTAYASTLQPSATVQPGTAVSMQSTVEVVKGTNDAPPQLAEELTLLGPDGQALSSTTKQASVINGSGEYQTDFGFTMPRGVKDGKYIVRTTLLMNGRTVRTNETPMLVVG